MNTKILTKVLEELNKDKPDISYVKGMIETLVSLEEVTTVGSTIIHANTIPSNRAIADVSLDEAAILDAQAKASLETIKALSEKSTE